MKCFLDAHVDPQTASERHTSSSTGLEKSRVSTQCWRRWAGLPWSNDARLVECWCSTKCKVALHIAPPWKPNWSPSHHVNDTPMTNSSPCWPPEASIEAPPSSPKPSGTGTHYPWKWWRPPPLTLLCQGYEAERLPTVTPPPSTPTWFFLSSFFPVSPDQYNSKHPSYSCQNNQHVDCGPLKKKKTWSQAWKPEQKKPPEKKWLGPLVPFSTYSLIPVPCLKAWRKESSRDEMSWAIDAISAKKESCFPRTVIQAQVQQRMFTLILPVLYAVRKELERCGVFLLVIFLIITD